MLITDPLLIQTYLEFGATRTPDVAPSGKARLWWDQANSLWKLSVSGGAYAEVPSLVSGGLSASDLTTAVAAGAISNSLLGAPKLVTYQETVGYAAFTDGGGASGTFSLSTSIPAGARFLNTLVTAITGFAGDTSAVLIVGDGTDTDRYNTGTPSVFATAAAGVDMGAPSGTAWHTAAKTPILTVTSATDWGAVNAGALTVTLFWLQAS